MPLPTWLARSNRRFTNRVTRPFAAHLPGFAVVRHTGRRTGRRYRTPVNLFRTADEDGYVVALTYGRHRDWVRNVEAAGSCDVETRGHLVHLADPRIVVDHAAAIVPAAVRPILRLIKVTTFLVLRAGPMEDPARAGGPSGP